LAFTGASAPSTASPRTSRPIGSVTPRGCASSVSRTTAIGLESPARRTTTSALQTSRPDFWRSTRPGHELYVHEQRVRDADARLNVKRAEIARLEDAAARSGLRAIKESSTVEQRVQSVLDARQYAERIGRLKAEVAQLERDRVLYAQELAAYRATVASTH